MNTAKGCKRSCSFYPYVQNFDMGFLSMIFPASKALTCQGDMRGLPLNGRITFGEILEEIQMSGEVGDTAKD